MKITLRLLSVFSEDEQHKFKKDLILKARTCERNKINKIYKSWFSKYDTIKYLGRIFKILIYAKNDFII